MKRFLIIIFPLFISTIIFSQNYYKDTFEFETKNVKCIYEYPVLKGEKYSNINKQLKEKGEQSIDFEIPSDIEVFKVFNLDKNGIYFIFNEYEFLPYYFGSFTVFITHKEFSKLIEK